MEHRLGQRTECRLAAVLHARDGRRINGEILDISGGGAFVRILDPVAAPRGLIKLKFRAELPDEVLCEWWSLVVRESAAGIGVMFDTRHNEIAPCRMRRLPESVGQTLSA